MTQLTIEISDALARRLAWLTSEQKKASSKWLLNN